MARLLYRCVDNLDLGPAHDPLKLALRTWRTSSRFSVGAAATFRVNPAPSRSTNKLCRLSEFCRKYCAIGGSNESKMRQESSSR
jgi:hypothetical protein